MPTTLYGVRVPVQCLRRRNERKKSTPSEFEFSRRTIVQRVNECGMCKFRVPDARKSCVCVRGDVSIWILNTKNSIQTDGNEYKIFAHLHTGNGLVYRSHEYIDTHTHTQTHTFLIPVCIEQRMFGSRHILIIILGFQKHLYRWLLHGIQFILVNSNERSLFPTPLEDIVIANCFFRLWQVTYHFTKFTNHSLLLKRSHWNQVKF